MKLEKLYNMYLNKEIDLTKDLVEVNSPDGWVKIVDIIDRGTQPVYAILFHDSTKLCCTLNHKIETITGWKRAGDLTEFDLILGKSGYVILTSKIFIGEQQTIDLEVEHNNHRFFCNDISVHNSTKGLEFKHVICGGFTYKSQKMAKPTVEELNIMYVAFSRAIESLLVVHSDIITYMGEEIKGHKQKWLKKLLQDLEN